MDWQSLCLLVCTYLKINYSSNPRFSSDSDYYDEKTFPGF